MHTFTHLDSEGHARMVDVTQKEPTVRSATASGFVHCSPTVVSALREGTVPKGDALAVARVAGIAGAKRCPELPPLAHVIAVHAVSVDLDVTDEGVAIEATVKAHVSRLLTKLAVTNRVHIAILVHDARS